MVDDHEFCECEEVTDDRPIRQGHIFEWLAPEDPWKLLGVVVTANCDIVQEKHRGILSYIPILPIAHYLRLFYVPKLLERGRRRLVDELTKTMRDHQAELQEFPEPLSELAALEWALRGTAGEIADELRVDHPRMRAKLIRLIDDYRLVQSALKGILAEQVEALVRMRLRQGGTDAKVRDGAWKDIQSGVDDLPGDCFFIGCISTGHRSGYVAYLRLVREIQDTHIAIKQSDLRVSPPPPARRMAQLQSPFIYRLTQQLADVFASIGLPDEYDQNRQRLVQSLATNTPSGAEHKPAPSTSQ